MTLLHIHKTVADHTLQFDHPLEEHCSLALLSCHFTNKMMNLSSEGRFYDRNMTIVLRIPEGNYENPAQVGRAIDEAIFLGNKPVKVNETNLLTLH